MKLQIITLFLVLGCISYLTDRVSCDEHEYRLIQDLMLNYDKRIRPSKNASDLLNVTFGLALAQIIDVDEKNQILTTNCWLNQAWMDNKMRWDPTQYGGVKTIRLPYNSIWLPDIILYNNADINSFMSSVSTNVIVNYEGNITWLSSVIYKSACTINVANFPFDEQNCSMLFASWTYDGYALNLMSVSKEGDISNYMPSTEWKLRKLYVERNIKFYSCCDEPYPDITYYINIRRRPMFYVFNMMMPCVLITLVALLGFYVPSDSGEKVTMGITTLLSMTVFLMLVTESMPPSSENLPLIGLYYGMTIAIVTGSTAMTVLTLNIHHKGMHGKAPPKWVKKVCFGILTKILCMRLDFIEEPDMVPQTVDMGPKGMYVKLKPSKEFRRRSSQREAEAANGDVSSHLLSNIVPCLHPQQRTYDEKIASENGGINSSPRFAKKLSNLGNNVSNSSTGNYDNFEKQFIKVLQKVYQTIEKNEIRLVEQDRREQIKLEWQNVALVVDRLLLLIFMMVTCGVTMGVLLSSQKGPDG